MSDGCEYVPVHRLRYLICGGVSSFIHRGDPHGKRWMCPHHGEGREDAPFAESGVGEIGRKFDYLGLVVVRGSDPAEIDASTDVLEQDVERADMVRFRDYEAVDILGELPGERAAERGVSRDAIRMSRRRAREALGVDGW